jgi:spore coat protein A
MIDRRRFLSGAAAGLLGSCRRRSSPSLDAGLCVASVPPPARRPLHLESLARFVDALPIPRVLEPDDFRPDPHDPGARIAYYRVPMRAVGVRVHRDLPPTKMWTYGGSVPGPTFETRSGRALLIEWRNELPEKHFLPIDHNLCGTGMDRPQVRTVVHVHGARVPPESDGHPESWYPPGGSALHHYPNRQDAAALWYHDHAMGIERLNQYAGLFGLFLIRDDVEDALRLPNGPHEIPLVLCDRIFDAEGQLVYPTSGSPEAPWVPEVRGDAVLVNGKLYPFLEVEPRRYRFRVLNSSNGRFYDLSMGYDGSLGHGQLLHQVGSDQGLLAAPVPQKILTLGPAERADLVVDFSGYAGQNVFLHNRVLPLMQFRVGGGGAVKAAPLPAMLRPVSRIPEAEAVKTRTLTLNEYMDPKTRTMLMLLDAKRWADPVTEKPELGTIEIWSFMNLTEDTHPIHLHLVRFQVLDRQLFDADEYQTSGTLRLAGKRMPPEPNEAGWKDTVRAEPGRITRIIVRFEGYAGRYLWHCHILEHAANEMMRPFEVVG